MTNPPPLPEVEARLSAGVAAGIITSDQALALRQLPLDARPERFSTVRPGDEPFALFRGFRDVFLALGIVILAMGLGGIASEVFGLRFDGVIGWDDFGLTVALAAIAWIVGEWVTARLRMPLASLVTAGVFALALTATGVTGLIAAGVWMPRLSPIEIFAPLFFALGGLVYYVRFRLPVALAFLAGGVALSVYQTVDELIGAGSAFQLYALVTGLLIFLVAISYELRDPARTSRHSENAFWLHLIAAPLIVFALTGGHDAMTITSTADAVQVFAVVAVLGLIALLIDRRAFIVSALLYLAGAITYAISQSGLPSNVQFAYTALVLGLFIVALALGWQPLRHAFLKMLPEDWASRLPNPSGPDALGG